MATITFSTLPPEIHVDIATFCDTSDLHNLCLTSKLMNQWFIRALYRYIDLQFDPNDYIFGGDHSQKWNIWKRQAQFVRALKSHPEYSKHIRSLKINAYITSLGPDSLTVQRDFWRTMQSLTHVQSVDLRSSFFRATTLGTRYIPNDLFPSATSVRLAGHMRCGVAKSILHAINPANLKYLCLDLVEENKAKRPDDWLSLGTILGPLTTLTGRCTVLRTLILRRIGQYHKYSLPQEDKRSRAAAEEASYLEWASFIRSVKGTVEEFTFEQFGEVPSHMINVEHEFSIMDERFSRLILPAIVSGNWPRLTAMKLRGGRDLNGRDGKPALMDQLRAVLGGGPMIVVEESTRRMEHKPRISHSYELF